MKPLNFTQCREIDSSIKTKQFSSTQIDKYLGSQIPIWKKGTQKEKRKKKS